MSDQPHPLARGGMAADVLQEGIASGVGNALTVTVAAPAAGLQLLITEILFSFDVPIPSIVQVDFKFGATRKFSIRLGVTSNPIPLLPLYFRTPDELKVTAATAFSIVIPALTGCTPTCAIFGKTVPVNN